METDILMAASFIFFNPDKRNYDRLFFQLYFPVCGFIVHVIKIVALCRVCDVFVVVFGSSLFGECGGP